jgi:hypothetical protein
MELAEDLDQWWHLVLAEFKLRVLLCETLFNISYWKIGKKRNVVPMTGVISLRFENMCSLNVIL